MTYTKLHILLSVQICVAQCYPRSSAATCVASITMIKMRIAKYTRNRAYFTRSKLFGKYGITRRIISIFYFTMRKCFAYSDSRNAERVLSGYPSATNKTLQPMAQVPSINLFIYFRFIWEQSILKIKLISILKTIFCH